MIEAKLNIILHENQKPLHASKARFKVVKAGKRFGKTKWALYEICKAAGMKPNGIFWYIAPTYGQAKKIAWRDLNWILPKELVKRSIENELTKELINGAVIQLIGADNKDALRGPKLDGAIFDEAAYIDFYAWDGIISSQLLGANGEPSGFAYFISSPNERGRNWFSNFFDEALAKMKAGDKDWAAWHFTIHDNPTLNADDVAKEKANKTDRTWNLEFLGIESENSGLIFTEFNESLHVGVYASKSPLILTRWLDWGIGHPTTCLFGEVDLSNPFVYVSNEFGAQNNLIEESCRIIRDMTPDKLIAWSVIDPSTNKRNSQTPRSDAQEFARFGIPCLMGNNRFSGYDITKMFFKKNMVMIHPKCKNLINQLKTLQWDDKTGDDFTDPLRYGLVEIRDRYFRELFEAQSAAIAPKPSSPFECSFYDTTLFPKRRRSNENSSMAWIQEEIDYANAA